MPAPTVIAPRQLTAEQICQHLTTSPLLPQLLRQLTIDRILAQWQPTLPPLTTIDQETKLQHFKQENWNHKVGSYYLTRKTQLDRVICSIIQVTDGMIAQELYFRICADPKIFSKLAFHYSQGAEAFDGGKVGPVAISKLHPTISTQLLLLQPGQISPLFTIENFYLFVKLEAIVPAQFDHDLRQLLLDELFEQWLNAKIVSEIGSVQIQSIDHELN